MLQQIMPEQVPYYWEAIKDKVDETLPKIPGEKNKLNNILASLLNGSMLCWIGYRMVGDRKKSNAFLLTSFVDDDLAEVRGLLIYCLFSIGRMDRSFWTEGFEALRKFGLSKGCTRLIAYSRDDFIIRMMRDLGGEVVYQFASIPM